MKTVENLTIYDNGIDGMSWEWHFIKNGISKSLYEGVSGDDMLDYCMSELVSESFFNNLSENEKGVFVSEYYRIKEKVKHHDYYDALDNTYKDYV